MVICTSPTHRLWLHGQVRNLVALVERGWQGLPICGVAGCLLIQVVLGEAPLSHSLVSGKIGPSLCFLLGSRAAGCGDSA